MRQESLGLRLAESFVILYLCRDQLAPVSFTDSIFPEKFRCSNTRERERERCRIHGYFRSSGIIVEVRGIIDKNEEREIEAYNISHCERLINFN